MIGAILGMPVGTALLIGLSIFFFGGAIIGAIFNGTLKGLEALKNAIFHK